MADAEEPLTVREEEELDSEEEELDSEEEELDSDEEELDREEEELANEEEDDGNEQDEDGDDGNVKEDDGDEENIPIDGGDGETLAEGRIEKPEGGKKKGPIPGIIYLGHIPPRLRPRHVRNMLSVHGEVGRIFLQAEDRAIRRKKKKAGSNARDFTEGWVEFRDKRVAKLLAASLNSTPMGTRKKNRFHDDLWNMKYLHRFRWSHLSERLAIEKQVRQQRMRAEVSQAKRETNFFLQNVERSKKFSKAERRKAAEPAGGSAAPDKQWSFTQRKTEAEIQILKAAGDGKRLQKRREQAQRAQERSQTNRSLLQKIFNASR